MRTAVVTILLLPFIALSAVVTEALTGNDVRKLSQGSKAFYVGAVVDTWIMLRDLHQAVPTASQPSPADRALIDLANCANQRRMTYEQALAVVEKFMTDNPGEWGYEMPFIVWRAFNQMCAAK